MFKILLIVAGCLGVLVVAVLIVAATKPDTFHVQRSASIQAPPDKIFPLIDDFKNWTAWSPYEYKDPAMKRTFGATVAGKGAVYEWDGNGQVGSGRITIVDTAPPSKVDIKLDMLRPITAHNDVEFTLVPEGGATKVTWAMTGQVPYVAKIMHVFFKLDRMVGGDFEAGLANLKRIAEK
jgi:carbon monoxide dehydrogenase subunit G